jgi:TPP-dependent pyruvate/acetoin dehydrogenase alpha subunit
LRFVKKKIIPFFGEIMPKPSIEVIKKMYQDAFTIRRFEEKAVEQYRLGNIRGYVHAYIGEEAIAVATISACRPDDYITSTHRGHGHAIAKGADPKYMYAELFGKSTGYCKGRGGSMHITNMAQGNLGANGIVGGGIPIAVGAAMAIRQKKGDQVVLCFFGDGSVNIGAFHESLNMAAIYHLPVIFILENNQYAVSTPIAIMTLIKNLALRAESYGMPGITLDGNDAVKLYQEMDEPIRRARKGEGPTLVECMTYRHGGHHINDPGAYMPRDEMEKWKSRDPLILLEKNLQAAGIKENEIKEIQQKVEKRLDAAIQFGLTSPEPSPQEFLTEIAD